jgi:hypothetical protein
VQVDVEVGRRPKTLDQRDGAALALFAASKPAIRRLRMDSPPVVSSPIFLAETGFLKMIKNVRYDGDDCK